MNWRDLYFTKRKLGVMVYIPKSKTDQAGQGAWVFIAGCIREQEMCPVRALQRLQEFHRQQTGVAPEGPVFRPLAASVGALSKTTVGQRLKKGLQAVGVRDWDLYSAHSLRRAVVREYLYCSPAALWSSRQQRG